eukprot:scaffold14920_cov63-Cylindrotheca_fusiformis.AAC.1
MQTLRMDAAMKQQLIFDDFDYQGELPSILDKGEIFFAGVPFSRGKIKYDERRKLYVTGPPGCGKTCRCIGIVSVGVEEGTSKVGIPLLLPYISRQEEVEEI